MLGKDACCKHNNITILYFKLGDIWRINVFKIVNDAALRRLVNEAYSYHYFVDRVIGAELWGAVGGGLPNPQNPVPTLVTDLNTFKLHTHSFSCH